MCYDLWDWFVGVVMCVDVICEVVPLGVVWVVICSVVSGVRDALV